MELLETTSNPLKLYRQAKRILKTTSRARNADWYKPATELPLQWHFWVGAAGTVSAIYNRTQGQWFQGPELPQFSTQEDDNGRIEGLDEGSRNAMHELMRRILSTKEFGAKPKSLGVVFHLADNLRTRDLAPDFGGDADFPALNELLITAPDVALGDDTVDRKEGNWRLLPLLGVTEGEKRAMAVQVSNMLEPVADELRNYGEMRNVPIIVSALSAPLEIVSAIPELLGDFGPSENTLSLLQYEAFTVICATGKRGELLMVRPLFHRAGDHLTQPETADVITKTAALLDMKSPKIFFLSLVGKSVQELEGYLEVYREANETAVYRCVNAMQLPVAEGVPAHRLELAVSTSLASHENTAGSHLAKLRERWTSQDFFGPSQDEMLRMPSRGDLQLLKLSGMIQKVAVLCLLGFAGWTGMDFFTKMRSEAWKLAPAAAQEMELRLAELQKERKDWEHWNNLLAKRSEGWLAMEALLELFPDDGGVILRSANYRAEATVTSAAGPGAAAPEKKAVGLERMWEVNGYANPEVATQLSTLGSRSRVADLLNDIAKKNQADYLTVGAESRSLQVSLQQKQGTMPSSYEFPAKVARHFRTSFELIIEQSLTPADELAININSNPAP